MIGVYTADLEDAYQAAIWRGIAREAKRRAMGLICFVGSRLHSPIPAEAASNFAFEIARDTEIDGVIVVSAAIATFLEKSDVAVLFSRRFRRPVTVSVGVPVRGVSSVTVDGTEALSEVVRHLIEEHGRRRFAVVAGPTGHAEANQRLATIETTLQEAGLRLDPSLVSPGTFVHESGALAAREIVRTGLPFDALICTNDRMAIGALEELRRSGFAVPEDISVVGFDGIEEGQCVIPPLTTIRQPLSELGERAVAMLCNRMDGGRVEHTVLHCTSMYAESCGCLPIIQPEAEPVGARLAIREPGSETVVAPAVISDELAAAAVESDEALFLAHLNRELRSNADVGIDLHSWHSSLSRLRREVSPFRPTGKSVHGDHASTTSDLFDRAEILVSQIAARKQAERRVAAEHQFETIRKIGASLAGVFEFPRLFDHLREGFALLGIQTGYLCLFETSGEDGPRRATRSARLVLSYPENPNMASSRAPFESARLLPSEIPEDWRTHQWVFEPLVFQDEELGYLMLSGDLERLATYSSLRDQVASATKGSLLFRQVRDHERSLESEVTRRTEELTRANFELIEENRRRARLEQEIVEISNRTMERIGQDLHDDLCQHLAGVAMLTSVARQSLGDNCRSSEHQMQEIELLLNASIDRVKQIARGMMPTGLEAHGLAAAVESLVSSARKGHSVAIDFRSTPDFTLNDTDRALQVYRIVQEALSNALKHANAERIAVSLYRDHGLLPDGSTPVTFLIAEIADTGTGMKKVQPGEGMGLRIMRYRAEKAKAEIEISSDEAGTRVLCRIPVRNRGPR